MSQRNTTITSYFDPKDKPNKKTTKADKPISPPPTSRPPQQSSKGKGKRPLSGSPTPIPEKRQDTKSQDTKPSIRHLSHKDLPSNWSISPPSSSPKLSLTYQTGDIFAAAPHTLLIHACNTQGVWGSGIALALRSQYPAAYTIYRDFCTKEHLLKSSPVPTGTALLIPPVDGNKSHWVGCLFTSAKYGKSKDKPDTIIANTAPAMGMLLELVRRTEEEGKGKVEGVRMCRINSGKFGVPWERTGSVLEGMQVREGWKGSVQVWEPSDA